MACVGEIQEAKAVAYKSLSAVHNQAKANPPSDCLTMHDLQHNSTYSNNLFVLWLIHDQTMMQTNKKERYTLHNLTQDIHSVPKQIRFLRYVQEHCANLFQQNEIGDNPYFDRRVLDDSMAVIEEYYQIDP